MVVRSRIPVLALAAFLLPMTLAGSGCTTGASEPSAFGKTPRAGLSNGSEGLREARVLAEAGEYTAAIPRLLHVVSKSAGTPSGIEAKYWLGYSYFGTSSYRDALLEFDGYLQAAPEGPYAAEAQAFIERIQAEQAPVLITPQELDARIDSARSEATAEPGDTAKQLELAELLWRRGDYESAGAIYRTLLSRNPSLAVEAPLSQRMEQLPTGQWIILTPAEIERRAIEQKPLEIVNINSFRSGEDLFTREEQYYVVTGQAHNRSDSVLYNVQVHVTIYAFGSVILDTTTVTYNRLNPGEKRAFSVRFSNFDNINNIVDEECIGTFEK